VDPVEECLRISIPLPLIKDGFFAFNHLFIKRKVGIFSFRQHNFIEQKRKYVIFLDIGEILEKGVHESSVCDTGVDFLISTFLSNSHSKFPTILEINVDVKYVGEDERTDG
jgi:hypothetical protein